MCGILGQISLNDKKLNYNSDLFNEALSLQYHRGPDDSGIIKSEKFIFGHRRLSILDLSSNAKQPFVSHDNKVIVTFNGEIYNYKELKTTLEKKGYLFKTSSDTEVLLYSYYEYGIECIKKFIGMFAFAIYDKRTNVSYIVRDRLGVKPLYYVNNIENIIFSSEIKSIIKFDSKKLELNKDAVSSYLSFRYPILSDTFFKNILSLEPAHYLKMTNTGVEKVEYWNVSDKFKEQKNDKGEEYYISRLRSLLESAVNYRMISDVPLGSFLSGGVDSSVITALMSKNSLEKIKTFTIGFTEDGFNELAYAKLVSKQYSTEHKEIILTSENYIEVMEELILYKDAPLSVPNEVPLYLMSKELKKDITVILSGEGADEIFGGYGRIFRSPYDYERIKNIDNLDISSKEKRVLSENFIKKYLVDDFDDEVNHFMNIYSYTSLKEKKDLLSIDLDEMESKLLNKFMKYFDELEEDSYYNKILYTFEKVHLLGLLHRLDTTTMAASVEARVPFVDHRLVEFAFTIPMKYKLKWDEQKSKNNSKLLMSNDISEVYDTPKYILKKSYEHMLPSEILYRKKMGFPVPLNKWFDGSFNEYVKKNLLSNKAKSRKIYNVEKIKNYLSSDQLNTNHSFAMTMWMLVNLEIFLQRYFDENSFSSN